MKSFNVEVEEFYGGFLYVLDSADVRSSQEEFWMFPPTLGCYQYSVTSRSPDPELFNAGEIAQETP